MKREHGFTLLEVVVTLAVFGVFLWIIVILTADMMKWEKRLPVNFMVHPQASAAVSRLRKDVLDAVSPYYLEEWDGYRMSPTTLILSSLRESGAITIVWDFSQGGEVRRRIYNVGALESEWIARGTPNFKIDDFPIPGHPDSVRILARDSRGNLAIDQIFQPRPHS